MADSYYLSMSIGPVQSFVMQARRTRDLWAGSWLLSYFASTMLATAENNGGKAVFPFRHENDVGQVNASKTAIGGYPNCMQLYFTSHAQAKESAKKAEEAFNKKWEDLSSKVWDRYIQEVANEYGNDNGNACSEIWKRQVDNFWEITWTIHPNSGDEQCSDVVIHRKFMRNVPATEEPGTKCSIMPFYQEISGFVGIKSEIRRKQNLFWEKVSDEVGKFDIKETERLCAIAVIKRLFPAVINDYLENPSQELLNRIKTPSTAFMAALPWLKKIGEARCKDYIKTACDKGFHCNDDAAAKEFHIDWAKIDASVWFTSGLKTHESHDTVELEKSLRRLFEDAENCQPSPFYAILLMDGDSMGELARKYKDRQQNISESCNKFAHQVEGIVQDKCGRAIYAGGDDVLAIIPAKEALPAAQELKLEYERSFLSTAELAPEQGASISGAIVYAHFQYPLMEVLKQAHHLLDDVAKDTTGRDALAMCLLPKSGINAVWSVPWGIITGKQPGTQPFTELIDKFGSAVEDNSDDEMPSYNTSFLYSLQQQFTKLFNQPIGFPGEYGQIPMMDTDDFLLTLTNAQYRRRMSKKQCQDNAPDKTLEALRPLMALTQRWTRMKNESSFTIEPDPKTFSFDGWRMALFLKQLRDGKVVDHGD